MHNTVKQPYTIALTGGIASGKSTVAKLFAKCGAAIIEADELAREVVKPGSVAHGQIIERFGADIVTGTDHIDRAKLSALIFSNSEQRRWLEALLHPLILTEMQAQLAHSAAPYNIAVIPLLFETSRPPFIDRILVVDAPTELQLKRTMTRDALQKRHAQSIIDAQISREHRLAGADDIVQNTLAREALTEHIEHLHQLYLTLAADKNTC